MRIPEGESIVEVKTCPISGEEFAVTDKDLEFYDQISPIFADKKYPVPSPSLSPKERLRRRLAWRNERTLYARKCDLSGKSIISLYPPDSRYTVYSPDIWHGDDWDGFSYALDFDFSRDFFSQFQDLLVATPKPALANGFGENSNYCNQTYHLKDCYLCFCTDYSDHCSYVDNSFESSYCVDCLNVEKCEHCYQCIACVESYGCSYSQNCLGSRDCLFCFDCDGCSSCFGCTNLKNKKYHFFNTELSPEEYRNRVDEYHADPEKFFPKMQDRYEQMKKDAVFRQNQNTSCESCTGDYLQNCDRAYNCFEARKLQECKHVVLSPGPTYNSHDIIGSLGSWNYEGTSIDGDNILFSAYNYPGNRNVLYSHYCSQASHDIFGCCSLKKASYCILNTPYSKQEYEVLGAKIIDHMISTGEWGEFFPHALSLFGYNETIAQDFYPMTQQQIEEQDWNWSHIGDRDTMVSGYTPLSIASYNEMHVEKSTAQKNISEIVSTPILCEKTKKPFKITKSELVFYIEHSIPIPTKHPNVRYKERLSQRSLRELRNALCYLCSKDIEHAYAQGSAQKIYCEKCYRETVY